MGSKIVALVAGCSIFGLAGGGQAWAQAASPADSAPTDAGARADQYGYDSQDIVVTARKREESLSKVPVAVSAFSGAKLEETGIKSALDIGNFTPGLRVAQSLQADSSAVFTLRGQAASEIQLTFDQPVGVYVDGVNYPRVYGLSAAFFDLDRIEVLKGPQGTLYGRNTTGGAINLVSKNADYDGEHGYIFAELGNHASRRVNGAMNVELVDDKLAARIAFQNWTRDGYGTSRITGQDVGGNKNQTYIRGSLQFDPTSNLSIGLKADVLRIRENGPLLTPRFYLPMANADQQVAIDLGLDPTLPASITAARAALQDAVNRGTADFFTSDINDKQFDDLDAVSVGLTIAYDISDAVSIKSISGFRRFKNDRQMDLDGTRFNLLLYGADSPGPNYFPPFALVKDRLFTQELNLTGEAGPLTWLVGGFVSDEKGDDSSTNNLWADQIRVVQGNPYTINQTHVIDIINRSWSIFTQNDVRLSDRITLTGGLRYNRETKGLTQLNNRFAPSTGLYQCNTTSTAVVTDPMQCAVTRRATFEGWSWLASISNQITDDVLLYAKISQGFKGGGFDTRPIAPPFQPEKAREIEVGMKGRLLDGLLRTNIAAYTTRYSNKQETAIVPVGNVNTVLTTNAARARIRGFEADVTLQPAQGLSLGGTVAYLDGKYNSYPTALNRLNQVVDASGEHFPNPPWTYTLNARYQFFAPNARIAMQADWSWAAGARPTPRLVDQALPVALVDELVRSDVGLLNLRLDYTIESADVTIALFATNALNKKYQILGSTRAGGGGPQLAVTREPRMFGISFRKSFGGE